MIFFFNFGASLISKCQNLMSLPQELSERSWHFSFCLFLDLLQLLEFLCQSLCAYLYLCKRKTVVCFVPSLYRIPNIPILYSLLTQTALHCNFCACTYSIWPPSHTHQRAQKHAHAVAHSLSYQDVRGVSDSVLSLGGCWISLLQLWQPVSAGNYSGWWCGFQSLALDTNTAIQILLMMCACCRIPFLEQMLSAQFHPKDHFPITLQACGDCQFQAEQLYLNDLKEHLTGKSFQ